MSATEHLEMEIRRLVAGIPIGVDPGLDDYRQNLGDTSYSTGINRHIRAFLLYRNYAESGSKFLDWGCRHAWDSCLVRMVNKNAEIEGCDITDDIAANTKAFAGMKYTRLEHSWKLPYADNAFDRVIGSGVLEHVPLMSASLDELYRIIEPGGFLMITFLPNSYSYSEFIARNVFRNFCHRRLYTKACLRRLLLEHGFEPVKMGHHQVMPSLTSGHRHLPWQWMRRTFQALFKLDPFLEHIWPLKILSANLYAVARKREYI
jgi:ubiquinone/menaquinone biosynthesis C-methylase UbiE